MITTPRLTGVFLLAACLLIVGCAKNNANSSSTTHGVFTTLSYNDAEESAQDSDKLFIIDATATWCAPCKKMEKLTWADQRVIEWFNTHAVAVKLDVDQDPTRAQDLGITAMPTVIVFKDGEEFDRVLGYQNADDLLAWLDGLTRGERAIDKLRERAGDRLDDAGTVDVQARYKLAETLTNQGKFAEATEEYLWLWDNMLTYEPAMAGVRVSFMTSDMERLAQQSPQAMQAFTALSDRYQSAVNDDTAAWEEMTDWARLNQVVADSDATLAWFDRVREEPKFASTIERLAIDLFPLLIEKDRWADAGRVYANPVRRMRWHIETNTQQAEVIAGIEMSQEQRTISDQVTARSFRERAAVLYASCLAAGREDEAFEVARLAFEYQDTSEARIIFVETALLADQPRPHQLEWLDEGDLRTRLEIALEESQSSPDV